MTDTSNDIKEIRARYKKLDKQFAQAEKDIATLKTFIQEYEAIFENLQALEQYYHSEQWLSDREAFYKNTKDEFYNVAGEDQIWNLSQEAFTAQINLLKAVSARL